MKEHSSRNLVRAVVSLMFVESIAAGMSASFTVTGGVSNRHASTSSGPVLSDENGDICVLLWSDESNGHTINSSHRIGLMISEVMGGEMVRRSIIRIDQKMHE